MNAIILCEKLVKDIYNKFDASHDFLHIERVRKNALTIASTEINIDLEIIELAVLLHDVSDPKYSNEGKFMEDYIIEQLELTDVSKDKVKKSFNLFPLMEEMRQPRIRSRQRLLETQIG